MRRFGVVRHLGLVASRNLQKFGIVELLGGWSGIGASPIIGATLVIRCTGIPVLSWTTTTTDV